jgi:aminoglycoside phosphotransferase
MNRQRCDAVLHDAVEARELSGLSGAQVFLMTKDSRHWFVRKAARSPAAGARLRGQAAKQAAFDEKLDGVVRTPRILDQGEIDGLYYYDMEFVRGPDGASYLRQASYQEVAALTERLCNYVRAAAERPPLIGGQSGSLFDALFAKLCEVQRSTGLISAANQARLFLALDCVRRLGDLPATLCHGDLTLQNMVVDHDGVLWVVDLLDSPFEHYWQDVAKLHQDLAGGWFLAAQPPVSQCVLDFVSQRVMQAATGLHPGYPQVHALLVACAFVRILPYARTPEEQRFVTDRVDYFATLTAAERGE